VSGDTGVVSGGATRTVGAGGSSTRALSGRWADAEAATPSAINAANAERQRAPSLMRAGGSAWESNPPNPTESGRMQF